MILASLLLAAVASTHPRLLLSAPEKARLVAKMNANDPSWLALKARADTLAAESINPYKFASSSAAPPGTIYYTYQGEGWYEAALPLAFAYQMSGDTRYSDKLIALAQEMMRAQNDSDNNPPNGQPPIRLDSYYASRNVAAVIAFIYDFCYDRINDPLKSQMVALMNDYFDDVRVNGYQAQTFSNAADGNYFGGHLYGVALMGYASFGDNPRAQEMIDWARVRFDGVRGATVTDDRMPLAWRSQCFDGGMRPAAALDFNGPDVKGSPFKGGFDFQAWSYGSEEFSRMIDYMLVVKSATGEDLIAPHLDWFAQILRAEKHALFPNRFLIDPTGDWGGYQGAVISKGLPARLAFVLAGTADGPGAQHFLNTEIAPSSNPDITVYDAPEWVRFFFDDVARPSAELSLPPFYSGFATGNGAIPYFIMRSDWTDSATWASIQMGSQWWDDHQHYHAGHLVIARGGDFLLVGAGDWKTEVDSAGSPLYGRSGVLGTSLEALQSSLANTLYFDDFGDFQGTDDRASGGQSAVGVDALKASEMNADYTFVRADLSSAYNRSGDPADAANRKLDFFDRSFVYVRASNTFVVYDRVQAKPSANARGAYRKYLRWHVPERPAITGTVAQIDHGQSRLFIDTVLPANAALSVVDEWKNPDPCEPSDTGCVPFGANTATFRIEVRDPQNPLFVPFLTVLQPGTQTMSAPAVVLLASNDGQMTGVTIGAQTALLFNSGSAPVTSTSYKSGAARHMLTGLVPNAAYSVTIANGTVRVDQNAGGNRTASSAGVLVFTTAPSRRRAVRP